MVFGMIGLSARAAGTWLLIASDERLASVHYPLQSIGAVIGFWRRGRAMTRSTWEASAPMRRQLGSSRDAIGLCRLPGCS